MNADRAVAGAKVIPIPPPAIYVIAFTVGILLHALTGDELGGRPATAWLAVALIVAGLAFAAGAIGMFARAHTTIIPHHQVSSLVTSGPLRFSRNPMYTGLILITIGAALTIGTWWPLVTLIPAVVIIGRWVIGPEERYLTATFGQEYADYCASVRRWI